MQAAKLLNRPRVLANPARGVCPPAPLRNIRLRVAALEQPEASFAAPQEDSLVQPSRRSLPEVDPELARELEVEELDAAQEQLLSWMMLGEEEQEEDLDEMVDYDEFGDEEYEELYEELEELIDAADVELKVGDKVVGNVYEVDEDGAYVEIGQKYSGFVPLSECSFARLKTVRIGVSADFVGRFGVFLLDTVRCLSAAPGGSARGHEAGVPGG